jgi:hypothetical protein
VLGIFCNYIHYVAIIKQINIIIFEETQYEMIILKNMVVWEETLTIELINFYCNREITHNLSFEF